MAADNFDIALELIISEYLLLERLYPVAIWAAHKIMQKLSVNGRLSSPNSMHTEKFSETCPDEVDWAHCYHTMLVMGLLCLILDDEAVSGTQIDERSALIVGETIQRAAKYDLLSVMKVLNADLFDIDPDIKPECRRLLNDFIAHHTNDLQGVGYWADEPFGLHLNGDESLRIFEKEIDLQVQAEFHKLQRGM